jgi:hypothetical protein
MGKRVNRRPVLTAVCPRKVDARSSPIALSYRSTFNRRHVPQVEVRLSATQISPSLVVHSGVCLHRMPSSDAAGRAASAEAGRS